MLPQLITEAEAAKALDCADGTLRNWRSEGKGPPFLKIEGKVRYQAKDLVEWLRERTVTPDRRVSSLADRSSRPGRPTKRRSDRVR